MDGLQKKTEELLKMVEREPDTVHPIKSDLDEEEKEEEEEKNTNDHENKFEEKILKALANTEKEAESPEEEEEEEEEEEVKVESEEKNTLEEKILKALKNTEISAEPEDKEPESGPEHTLTIIIKKPQPYDNDEPEGDNIIITDKETDSSGNFVETKVTRLNLEEDPDDKKYKITQTKE